MVDLDGICKQQYLDFYNRLSQTGLGLIITGHMYICKNGRTNQGMTNGYDQRQHPWFNKLTSQVHQHKSVIFAQLNHAGAKALSEPAMKKQRMAPTGNKVIQTMNLQDIEDVIESFSQSALLMKQTGFDGIQLQAAHVFLVEQFLSKQLNKRRDRYGGSLENRQRFLLDIIARIREKVGLHFPIIIKLDSHTRSYAGIRLLPIQLITLDESLNTARRLEEAGVDGIEVSYGFSASKGAVSYKLSIQSLYIGNNDYQKARVAGWLFTPVDWVLNHPAWFKPHHNLKNIQRFKQTLDIPVLAGSCFRDPIVMRRVIEMNQADMICMARPLIRNPDFAKQVVTGGKCSSCLNCNLCLMSIPSGKTLRCYYGKPPKLFS